MRVESLRVLQYCGSFFLATASSLTRATADSAVSNVVDLYNSATGAWSTAQLSVARSEFAAASAGNVALFAGGFPNYPTGALLCREGAGRGGLVVFVFACVLRFCACCNIAVLFSLPPLPLSRAPLQILLFPMLWTCTTVQQGHGLRLSSAWRAVNLQLHRPGTLPCSLGVTPQVCCFAERGG